MFLKPLEHDTDSIESSKILTLWKTCEIKNLLCACHMLRQGQWNSAGANFVKDKLISVSRSDKYKKHTETVVFFQHQEKSNYCQQ